MTPLLKECLILLSTKDPLAYQAVKVMEGNIKQPDVLSMDDDKELHAWADRHGIDLEEHFYDTNDT